MLLVRNFWFSYLGVLDINKILIKWNMYVFYLYIPKKSQILHLSDIERGSIFRQRPVEAKPLANRDGLS